MKSKKFKNMEIMNEFQGGDILVLYNQFDMGQKYKIYKKLDGMKNYIYIQSFNTISEAYEYAKFISF